MSKFDIRQYLAENKLTETGRVKRTHFDNVELNKKVVLNEMVMKADDDSDSCFIDRSSFEEAYGRSEAKKVIGEAGYTDDDFDDDFGGGDGDLDFSAGDSEVNRLGGNKKARRAFSHDNDTDFSAPEADDVPEDSAEDGDGDEFEAPEQMSDKAGSAPDLASNLKYDPNQIEFEMDDEELNDFLNGFKRPQVAVKVLQRALDQAKSELEDSPAMRRLYLILDNGFYKTAAFRKGNVIATIRR